MLGSFGLFLMVFLTLLIFWPLGSLVRRIRKRAPSASAASKRARWLVGIVSGLNLVFLVGLLLTIPIITSLLTLAVLAMTFLAWKDGYWSILGRIYYSFITVTALVFILWANYWNLLGFRF